MDVHEFMGKHVSCVIDGGKAVAFLVAIDANEAIIASQPFVLPPAVLNGLLLSLEAMALDLI